MSNYSLSDLTHCFRLDLPCLFSKLQLPILVTAPRLTARFFRNPSSLTRYGQNGWYPQRGPTTRLAALDAERIPNCKGTSRCVNDDPAPGQGWPREGECGLPSLASVVSRSELVIGTSLQVWMAQQRLNVTRLCGIGPPHTTTIYWVLIPYICEYTDFIRGIYPRVMCLTSEGSSSPEMTGASQWPAFTRSLPRRTSLVWRSGSPLCGDETLTAWHSSELNCFSTGLNSPTAAAVPFYTRPQLRAASPHACSRPSQRWYT